MGAAAAGSVSVYKGIEEVPKNYDDINQVVEQESTFWYFFGVKESHCYGLIHHDTGKTVLFVPKFDEGYKLWMYVKSLEQFKKELDVDEVIYETEMREYIEKVSPSCIYLFTGVDTDSGISPAEP